LDDDVEVPGALNHIKDAMVVVDPDALAICYPTQAVFDRHDRYVSARICSGEVFQDLSGVAPQKDVAGTGSDCATSLKYRR
jgi:hypothetical protein